VFCVATKSAPLQWAWALGLVMACLTGGFATSRLQAQTASFSDAIATLGGGFSNPSGVAVDGSGNVYVADYNNSAVKEMPAGCTSSSCVTTLGGGFNHPFGVAVDGSGNVYVADTDNNAVKEMPAGCASSNCVTTLGGGFKYPNSVAVDGSGNVSVADSGNNAVKEMPAGCASSSCVTTLGSGFNDPFGVAVDGSGNVYVADTFNGALKEMPAGCASSSCVTTLGGGLADPLGVAVDGNGNVYVTVSADNAVKEMPAGCVSSNCVTTLGGTFGNPFGVAVDGSGNVYVADWDNNAVKEIMPHGVNFFAVPVGTASTPLTLTFTFESAGSLSGTTPYQVLTQGATNLDFNAAATQESNACSGTTAYTTGETCTVNVTFTPQHPGTRYGAVSLLSASGAVIATAYLEGTGVGPQVNFLPGTQSVIANTATEGLFFPEWVAVDASGNVYFSDNESSRVLKETLSAGNYTQSVVANSATNGLDGPEEVAVDGNGNVYIADFWNNRVLQETLSAGGYIQSVVANSATNDLHGPYGVAVDGSGNVYITDDFGGGRLLKETLSAGGYTQSVIADSQTNGLSSPEGVAVDGSGNVYIADLYNAVLKETLSAGSYTQSIVADAATNGLDEPYGVAVDGNGNVFIGDTDNERVLKETLSAGGYTQSVLANFVSNGLASPQGVAVDGSGNVYIADSARYRVLKEDFADPPSLTFAATAIGSTSSDSPQAVTVENVGNLPLDAVAPGLAFTVPSFTQVAGPGTPADCTSSFALAPGAGCNISISFTPTESGSVSGALVLTDDSLNGTNAQQSISLSGTGQFTASTMTLPTPGSTLTGASTTFTWNAGPAGTTGYGLNVGTTPGGADLVNIGPLSGTSVIVNLPTSGAKIYVRLWTIFNGATYFYNDYTYTEFTQLASAIASPTPGGTLTSASTTFTWSAGSAGTTGYGLNVGTTGVGSADLVNIGPLSGTSVTVTLPTNGVTIYVRLWTILNGTTYLYNDYTYTEFSQSASAIISPAPGSTLASASTTFIWNAGPAGTTGYGLNVGTTGVGSADLVNIGPLSGTSVTVNLPTNGQKIYVRLWTILNGTTYLSNDYTYTEFTQLASAITSPAPGSTLTSAETTFAWNAAPAGVTGYGLNVGTTGVGSADLVNIYPTFGTAVPVDLPTNGATIYVRLWTVFNGTTYLYHDYTYTEFTHASAITSPAPGSTLTSASTTFTWNAGPAGTTGYGLNVGTTGVGSADLVNIGPLSGTSVTVNLPTNGTTIFVRLWTIVNGTTYLYNDYTYAEFTQ